MSLRQITLSYTEETRPILLRRLEDQVRTGEQMWLDYDPWREDEIVVQFESLVYGIRGCPTGPCPLDLTCSLPLHRLLGPLSQDEPRWMMAAWLAVHLVRARLTEDLVCQLVDGTRLSASDLTPAQMATLQGVMVGGRRVPVDTVELRETGIALHYRHPETGESSTELIPGNPGCQLRAFWELRRDWPGVEWSYEPALEGDLAELVWTATPTESQYTYLLTVAQMATLLDSRF